MLFLRDLAAWTRGRRSGGEVPQDDEEIGQAPKTTLRQRRAWFEASLREAPHHEVGR
jgi:hypothetical protein